MFRAVLFLVFVLGCTSAMFAEEAAVDYANQVAPLLKKYCAGCHNDSDMEGDFSLESFAALQQGVPDGPVILPGAAENSKLVRLLRGTAEPRMPPEDEAQPTADEIALIERWIDAGATGPQGEEPDRLAVRFPQLPRVEQPQPVTAIALSNDGELMAVARFGKVELFKQQPLRVLEPLPGKVTAVHFSADGQRLIVASGVVGLGGLAKLFNVEDGSVIREFKGHRDILYDAELSPDGKIVATCSYDQTIQLWNAETGELLHVLTGHNGAVYDVAFDPSSRFLVSASGDDTCKVWRIADGMRLDTLFQPLKEAYCCAFSPDGKYIIAGGADNNIRVWRFISHDKPRINPMVFARFAHESPIVRMSFLADGKRLVTAAEDCSIKLWETDRFTELKAWEDEPDVAVALASTGDRIVFGTLDGSIGDIDIQVEDRVVSSEGPTDVAAVLPAENEVNHVTEAEPNNAPSEANAIQLPALVTGVISGEVQGRSDCDFYRFSAKAGEQWVIEVNAARSKSKLDSFVEVLDVDGNRIERVKLQAVRDSYFTFRGKDASTIDDFRLFNWEEMRLDQYLYANGEVTRLWLYPRGPDSGFQVYPGQGARWGHFDTTPLAHGLGEPCYIVEPRLPDEPIVPNGLPVFPIYFENDDDSHRELGADSQLYFTAPRDGEYLLKIRDVRGYQGEEYTYKISVRPRRPDFKVSIHGANPTVSAGSGKEFTLRVNRRDRFDGPISVTVDGVPPGFFIPSPIVIEEGQIEARGIVFAAADAPQPTADNAKATRFLAKTTINGEQVEREVGSLGEIKLGGKPKLASLIVPMEGEAAPIQSAANGLLEFEMKPGETIQLKVVLTRTGYNGIVDFGKEGAGRNLPYGTYVDNVGLNGLLLLDGQNERNFFITADPVTRPQSRFFHIHTGAEGGQASWPVLLHIRPSQ